MADTKTETRQFTVLQRGLKPPSSNYSIIKCPFCLSKVQAFHWSLAGSGKRCYCGAKFNSFGEATKVVK